MQTTIESKVRISVPRRVIGWGLVLLGVLGVCSLTMKQGRLLLFGERATATVKSLEVTTSTKLLSKHDSHGQLRTGDRRRTSTSTHILLTYTTKEGLAAECETRALMGTVTKEGDLHPILYLRSDPRTACIVSARQLWMPMLMGTLFSGFALLFGLLSLRWGT